MTRPPGMENLPPMNHQTVSAIDIHQLNSQGLPELHIVTQRIVAVNDMDTVPFIVDASQADIAGVDAISDCRAGEPYTVDAFQVVDIKLHRALSAGQETEVTYGMRLNYRKAPPSEFLRRAGRLGMALTDMTVRFATDKLPANVWWGKYQEMGVSVPSIGPAGPALYMTPHEVTTAEGIVMRQVGHTAENLKEGTMFGFTWTWPESEGQPQSGR